MKQHVQLFEEYVGNSNPYVQIEMPTPDESKPTNWDPRDIKIDAEGLKPYLNKYPMIIAKQRENVIFTDLVDGPFAAVITGIETDEAGKVTGLNLKVIDNISGGGASGIDYWEIASDEETLYDTGVESFIQGDYDPTA